MDWNERQRIAKAINDNIESNGGKPPIRMGEKRFIDTDLEEFFDWADRTNPEIWNDFPPHVKEWWWQRKGTKGRGYVRHFRDFTPRLAQLKKAKKLTFNALIVFLAYRDAANDSTKVNKRGLKPGETNIGIKTLAGKAGVHFSEVSRANKLLEEAGLIKSRGRLWEHGPLVHWVDMGWARPDDGNG